MARVRSRNTDVELRLRTELRRIGVRYRIHFKVPGTPDLAFPAARLALFIDGCFWHGCPSHYTLPATNSDFWRAKLERNRSRDNRVDSELRAMGWRVVRLWEHQIETNLPKVATRIATIVAKRTVSLGHATSTAAVTGQVSSISNNSRKRAPKSAKTPIISATRKLSRRLN
jgi:DNA mismatch endonuclease, patch repair protein